MDFNVTFCISILPFWHGLQLQFVLEPFNTFEVFGPSKGHRVHKYYAYCNSVKSLFVRCFRKNEDHSFCNQCTFVQQEQLTQFAHSTSERDNISSRESRTNAKVTNVSESVTIPTRDRSPLLFHQGTHACLAKSSS